MNIDIYNCLNNLNVNYDLNNFYINSLFLLVRHMLKPFYKNYRLKKKYIVKEIYNYFENVMKINKKVIEISKLNNQFKEVKNGMMLDIIK